MRVDESFSAFLGVLRCRFVVGKVVSVEVERLVKGLRETVRRTRIDNYLEIGLACDGLAIRRRSPVVLLTDQDQGGNRWINVVIAVRIVRDESRNPRIVCSRCLQVGSI